MQAFYARRGMWSEGKPRGLLSVWLGERCPWMAPGVAVHSTTDAGLDALAADAEATGSEHEPGDVHDTSSCTRTQVYLARGKVRAAVSTISPHV